MNRDHELSRRIVGWSFHLIPVGALFGLASLLTVGCTSPSDPMPVGPHSSPAVPAAPTPPTVPAPTVGLPGVAGNFVLRAVNNQPLPVQCPYGTGQWDYDDDAGSWQLTESSFLMKVDGSYINALSDEAKSGATTSQAFTGTYTRISESTFEIHANGGTTIATITGDRLVWDWGNGTVLTFEAKSQ